MMVVALVSVLTVVRARCCALAHRCCSKRLWFVFVCMLGCYRLLQRNRNVQAVLESKQTVEGERKKTEIKTSLAPPRRTQEREKVDSGLSSSRKMATKKSFSGRKSGELDVDAAGGAGTE